MKNQAFSLLIRVSKRLPIKRLLPTALSNAVRGWVLSRMVQGLPDRLFLESAILPHLKSIGCRKILFVGCEAYNRDYGQIFRGSASEFWTTDIKPENSCWGEPGRHVVGDCLELGRSFANESFDAIVLSGVFGFGVNTIQAMNACLTSAHTVLASGGILVLGWNKTLIPDPRKLEAMNALFKPGSQLPFPDRQEFEGVSHVFDFLSAQR